MQAAHAALDFAVTHPVVTGRWHTESNTLVLLAAACEDDLEWLADDATARGHPVVAFREPDLGGALTAVALSPEASRLVRRLPLALREGVKS